MLASLGRIIPPALILCWLSVAYSLHSHKQFHGDTSSDNGSGTQQQLVHLDELDHHTNDDPLLFGTSNGTHRRAKRQIESSALVSMIVWDIIIAPLLGKAIDDNIEYNVFTLIKKCYKRSVEHGLISCSPAPSEIAHQEFGRNLLMETFKGINRKTVDLLRHEHEMMIGLQEPDTWG